MATCPVGGGRGDLTFVATANSVHLLKLIPIEVQVLFIGFYLRYDACGVHRRRHLEEASVFSLLTRFVRDPCLHLPEVEQVSLCASIRT